MWARTKKNLTSGWAKKQNGLSLNGPARLRMGVRAGTLCEHPGMREPYSSVDGCSLLTSSLSIEYSMKPLNISSQLCSAQ